MRLTIQLDDDLYEDYLKQAGSEETVPEEIAARLAAFSKVDPNRRNLVLHGQSLQDLEQVMEHPIADTDQLIRELKTFRTFRIGSIEVKLTEDELTRLQGMAEFHGKSSDEFLKDTIDEVMGYVLERVS